MLKDRERSVVVRRRKHNSIVLARGTSEFVATGVAGRIQRWFCVGDLSRVLSPGVSQLFRGVRPFGGVCVLLLARRSSLVVVGMLLVGE